MNEVKEKLSDNFVVKDTELHDPYLKITGVEVLRMIIQTGTK